MEMPPFVHPLTCLWVFGLFPGLAIVDRDATKPLCEQMPSFVSDKYLGVVWLDHMIGVYLTLKKKKHECIFF